MEGTGLCAGVTRLGLCDDDEVERTNLHRQILFGEADVGMPKVDAAARALRAISPGLELRLHRTRLLPDDAVGLVRDYDVVLEGSDNFATKFLAADACALARVPGVHASAVRWVGTALAVGAQVDRALALLDGRDAGGELVTFDGRTGALRRRRVSPRRDCPLCGDAPRIRRIEADTYVSPAC